MSQDHNSLPPTRGEGQGQRWTAGHTFVSSQLAVFDDSRVVATVGSAIGRDDDRTRADARLIAAAPALYEALDDLTTSITAAWPGLAESPPVARARAALSLAHPPSNHTEESKP